MGELTASTANARMQQDSCPQFLRGLTRSDKGTALVALCGYDLPFRIETNKRRQIFAQDLLFGRFHDVPLQHNHVGTKMYPEL